MRIARPTIRCTVLPPGCCLPPIAFHGVADGSVCRFGPNATEIRHYIYFLATKVFAAAYYGNGTFGLKLRPTSMRNFCGCAIDIPLKPQTYRYKKHSRKIKQRIERINHAIPRFVKVQSQKNVAYKIRKASESEQKH